MQLPCAAVQTDEARRWFIHQRVQQTPGTAVSAEVPGVSDWEKGQVCDRRNGGRRIKEKENLGVLLLTLFTGISMELIDRFFSSFDHTRF